MPILGIAFVGDAIEDSEATIAQIGGVQAAGPAAASRRARTPQTLRAAFAANFDVEDFR